MQKKNTIWIILFISIISLRVLLKSEAARAVNLECSNSIGGTWNFGTAPRSCDVSTLVSSTEVNGQYRSLFFDERLEESFSRPQYINLLFPVLRDIGQYYIKRRNPNVSEVEMNYFTDALFSVAHQESLWSHYRFGVDGIIRYMRGDNYHGHGIMQVDDRSHTAALIKGKGVDLVYNILYGLDIFYSNWIKSAKAKCVKSPNDFISRIRSSWSAYNGGPGKICRWKDRSTAGDTQFFEKFNSKKWMNYISDSNLNSPQNLKCLIEGIRPCYINKERSGHEYYIYTSKTENINENKFLFQDYQVDKLNNLSSYKLTKGYTYLRECPNFKCKKVLALIESDTDERPLIQNIKSDGSWLFIKVLSQNKYGWVYKDDVERFE